MPFLVLGQVMCFSLVLIRVFWIPLFIPPPPVSSVIPPPHPRLSPLRCPNKEAKTRVLKEMIFPNCEKLGQTIIFVRRCVCGGWEGGGLKRSWGRPSSLCAGVCVGGGRGGG